MGRYHITLLYAAYGDIDVGEVEARSEGEAIQKAREIVNTEGIEVDYHTIEEVTPPIITIITEEATNQISIEE